MSVTSVLNTLDLTKKKWTAINHNKEQDKTISSLMIVPVTSVEIKYGNIKANSNSGSKLFFIKTIKIPQTTRPDKLKGMNFIKWK